MTDSQKQHRGALWFLRCATFIGLLASFVAIFLLTEQSVADTSRLSQTVVYSIDDVVRVVTGNSPSANLTLGDSTSGVSVSVREGETISLSVDMPVQAEAVWWEYTDKYNPGTWFPLSGYTSTEFSLVFEGEGLQAQDYYLRCAVVLPDQSVVYSEYVSVEYRDMSGAIALARKVAHTAEFGIVGLFGTTALLAWFGNRWGYKRCIKVAVILCVCMSLFDQTHKLFVAGREFDVVDLFFDAIGYGAAIVLVRKIYRHLSTSS